MQNRPPFLVFSDLDGTLLDHTTYDWTPAKPALKRLTDMDVPVVLATSKTAAEVRVVQREMGLAHYPAIVENGAGVVGVSEAAPPKYTKLRSRLNALPAELHRPFIGFGDMSLDDVAKTTGLSRDAAALAKDREFSEPGLWTGTADQQSNFIAALAQCGILARAGGRFLTLSFGKTKKDRMSDIARHYAPRTSIALGDAPNDVEMLEYADLGVIIANPHHAPLPRLTGEDSGRIIRTRTPGPGGWNAAMNSILDGQTLLTKGNSIG
ncbi:MAG: HAD-IIB family hydrolase [Pseudomonadota bacterium]